MKNIRRSAGVALLCLSMAGHARAATYSLTGIGTLGGDTSTVSALSSDDSVVAGYSDTAGNAASIPFIWSNGSMTGITDMLGGTQITTSNILLSANGTTVAGNVTLAGDTVTDAYVWKNGTMTDISADLGGEWAAPGAISADGSVVAGALSTGTTLDLFRWSNGVTTDLGTLPSASPPNQLNDNAVRGMSADASTIVGYLYAQDGNDYPFIYSNGAFLNLGGVQGDINGISSDGTTAVGAVISNSTAAATVWKNGVATTLSLPGVSAYSYALGISTDGSTIIGYYINTAGTTYNGIIWKNEAPIDLGNIIAGGLQTAPTAVSANGSVVAGFYCDSTCTSLGYFRWTQATGSQPLTSILTQHNINSTGWDFSTVSSYPVLSANGNVMAGTASYNGNQTGFLFYDDEGNAGITTPQALAQALAPSTYATHQSEAFLLAGAAQSLVAARDAMGSFLSPTAARPQDIEPAAGGGNPLLTARNWSAYALGSFGAGQSNDFGNYTGNGTTGLFARLNDGLAVGAGIVGGGAHTDLQLGGNMNVTSYGLALNMDYETRSGLRVYGTASISSLNETINRHYLNASTLEGSHGETSGLSYGGAIRAGYEIFGCQDYCAKRDFSVMPYAELDLGHTQLNAYTETGGSQPGVFGAQNSNLAISRIGAEVSKPLNSRIDLRGRADWGHNIEASGTGMTVTDITITQTIPYSAGGQRNWAEGGLTGVYEASANTRLIADLGLKAGDTPEPAVTATFGVTVGF